MSEEGRGPERSGATGKGGDQAVSWITLSAAAVVILLAVGAGLWPHGSARHQSHTFLVFDSSGSQARLESVFLPLQESLGALSEGPLTLVRTANLSTFAVQLALGPDFVLAPDGLAMGLPDAGYLPLAVGRRPAPRNLRPRGVLVYRRSAGEVAEPWRSQPLRTVLGDSLSLAATGALRRAGLTGIPLGCACGPDPYDHGPVLHALRLGAFDFALVRQWDAARFFTEGLLDPAEYGVRELVGPVPDMVLMVSRQVPQHLRLRCGDGVNALGRRQGAESQPEQDLQRGLASLHLVGFNVLLEPDWELVRRNYPAGWLRGAN